MLKIFIAIAAVSGVALSPCSAVSVPCGSQDCPCEGIPDAVCVYGGSERPLPTPPAPPPSPPSPAPSPPAVTPAGTCNAGSKRATCKKTAGCKYSKKKGCRYDCAAHKGDATGCNAAGTDVCRWKKASENCVAAKPAKAAATTCDEITATKACRKSTLGCEWSVQNLECGSAATGCGSHGKNECKTNNPFCKWNKRRSTCLPITTPLTRT
eukprot:gene5041-3082_t